MKTEQLIYDLVSTQFVRTLKSLQSCLVKARTHAEERKFDANNYFELRLAPDMFNLMRQIQITSDNAKGAVARLTGSENPSFADTEKTWEEAMNRLDKTIAFVSKFKAEDYAGWETRNATFKPHSDKYLTGYDYLTSFAMPNFFFHVATSYNLLRHAGVNIGKKDYLGEVPWKNA